MQQMQQLLDILKAQGLTDLSLAHLDSARQLLIQYEQEVNQASITRLAILRYQHPTLSDSELIDVHVKLQQERAAKSPSYGSKLAQSATDSIWESLEQSGLLDEVAQELRFRMTDTILEKIVSGPINHQRVETRQSALNKTARNFGFLSHQKDSVIDVEYSEGDDDLNDIISQALGVSPRLKLAGDTFRGDTRSLPSAKPSSDNDGVNTPKKLPSALGNGKSG